jgi:hypothetical protein
MKTGLILTIGTRDVQIDRELILQNEPHQVYSDLYIDNKVLKARKGGEFLMRNYNRYKDNLKIPIAKAAIEFCLTEVSKIDHIILVTTDQAETVGEFFYQADTTYFGDLITKLLSERFKKGALPDVRKKTISNHVTYLDNMMLFWQAELHRKPYNLLKECDKVFLCNQGGIDAINTSLLLQCLNSYGNKVQVLQVDQRTGFCSPLEFTRIYLEDSERHKLHELLDNFQYSAVKKLEVNKNIRALAAYAEHRLMFDFDAALHTLHKLDVEHRNIKIDLQTRTSQIQGDPLLLLRELCLNAWVKFRQEAYVDFLLRFFRIREEIAKSKATSYLQVSFKNNSKWENDIKSLLSKPEFSDLKSYLLDKKISGKPLDYTKATTETFLAILKFFSEKEYNELRKYKKLSTLRNNSIGAHSFDPVSRASIEVELEKVGLTVEKMFDYLAEETRFDKIEYTRLNDIIKSIK